MLFLAHFQDQVHSVKHLFPYLYAFKHEDAIFREITLHYILSTIFSIDGKRFTYFCLLLYLSMST